MFGGPSRIGSGGGGGISRDEGRQRGVFTSPNHPQVYPPNVNCVLYTFITAPPEIVEITFSDFNLQIPATSKSDTHVPVYLYSVF